MLGSCQRTLFSLDTVLSSIDWGQLPQAPACLEIEEQTQTESATVRSNYDGHGNLVQQPCPKVDDCSQGTPQEVWDSANSGNEAAKIHLYGDSAGFGRCQGDCKVFLDYYYSHER